MGQFLRRLHYLLNRHRLDSELRNDLEFHREMAMQQGQKNFGGELRLREQSREAWGWTWIDRLQQDLRYAIRILWNAPGFTVTAVMVLGLGVGINIAAFGAFNQSLMKALPVRDPGSLIRLQRHSPCCSASEMPYASLDFYRKHATTLQAVIGTMGGSPMDFEGGSQPITNIFVTPNYFTELGASTTFGRLLDPTEDDAPDGAPVVVLGYGFWQRQFGADQSVLGKTIRLNKKTATVIGVIPYSFASLDGQQADVWLLLRQQPYFVEGSNVLTDTSLDKGRVRMFARLAVGVTAHVAEQELQILTTELRKEHPLEIWEGEFLNGDSAGHWLVMQREMYLAVALVSALVALILVVACANLGGLLLARGVVREREIGIRLAIGASRKRIFRQLFTESLLLGLLGSAAGFALGYFALRVMIARLGLPTWMSAAPDWRVSLFAVGLTGVSTILFGLTPALQIARQRQRKTIVRQILVAAQIAASCVLLIVATLLVRASEHALHTSPGWGYEQSLSINLELGNHGYSPVATQAFVNGFESRLRAIPGVTSVGLSSMPPLGHGRITTVGTEIAGRSVEVYPYVVDPEFFHTMGIPLLRGRNLMPGEKNAIIVSESLARQQWPREDPVGKQFWGNDTVIGVAGSARMVSPNDNDAAEIYHAAQVADMPDMIVVVKTAGAPEGLVPSIKSIVDNMDPKLFPEIRPLHAAFKESMVDVQRAAAIVSLLGVLAVVLAGVSIVGLVLFAISQRMKEIAIRIAMGAKPAQVIAALLQQFSWPLMLGLMTGLLIAAGFSKVLRKTLYGVNNLDPMSYAIALGILVVVVAMASLSPARRVLRMDLAKTLRYE